MTLRNLLILALSLLCLGTSACASRAARCDGSLEPINVSAASAERPSFDARTPSGAAPDAKANSARPAR